MTRDWLAGARIGSYGSYGSYGSWFNGSMVWLVVIVLVCWFVISIELEVKVRQVSIR
jgi:uncharacterized membrane protein